uniref:Thiamine pyrophosphokinase n=1 Tax=Haptolina brevifila TaxID=156173 RepID=A0A7S2FHH2_9EUKA|mmetsp:Transcript_12479/g.25050  ORF Transcript_12479/g.25050 Transcript_12479/m.25050 type:complete len:257 (+) Transcript_12479:57-827(+)
MPSPTTYHSTAFLTARSPLNFALLMLNVEPRAHARTHKRFEHLWRHASRRLCADGAANRLYDSLDESRRGDFLPDLIAGDLDSLRGDVADYYAALGVPIEGEADQETHDFEKCLRWLQRWQSNEANHGQSNPAAAYSVVAYGAIGGRLDQQMANLNMAYSYKCFRDFFLVSDHSLAFVLQPGSHVIEPNRQVEDGTCGLIPLGSRCEGVRTTGLRWNLDGVCALEFGGLISSSNEIVEAQVTVQTSTPLLWTTSLF